MEKPEDWAVFCHHCYSTSTLTINYYTMKRTSGQQSQQKKQRLEGIGRPQLGTAKGDLTDDIYIHAAPAWSTNSSESNIGKIQRAQN